MADLRPRERCAARRRRRRVDLACATAILRRFRRLEHLRALNDAARACVPVCVCVYVPVCACARVRVCACARVRVRVGRACVHVSCSCSSAALLLAPRRGRRSGRSAGKQTGCAWHLKRWGQGERCGWGRAGARAEVVARARVERYSVRHRSRPPTTHRSGQCLSRCAARPAR